MAAKFPARGESRPELKGIKPSNRRLPLREAGRDQYRQLLMGEVTPDLTAPGFETEKCPGLCSPGLRRKRTGVGTGLFSYHGTRRRGCCHGCTVLFQMHRLPRQGLRPCPALRAPVRSSRSPSHGLSRSNCNLTAANLFEEKNGGRAMVRLTDEVTPASLPQKCGKMIAEKCRRVRSTRRDSNPQPPSKERSS